ncbi:MAG: hypothetical protein JWP37_1219, partial [Mucilaginibacter sp.]|nr:hypothetical protein [Mucilaginibacter sp.]
SVFHGETCDSEIWVLRGYLNNVRLRHWGQSYRQSQLVLVLHKLLTFSILCFFIFLLACNVLVVVYLVALICNKNLTQFNNYIQVFLSK